MSESTNMDSTITDDVNMSTSLTTDDSSITVDSTIDEAGSGSFTVPMIESEEDELLNTTEPDDLPLADPKAPTEYYLIQLSSQCGATKLTDSAGYSYTKKMTRGNTTYWTCAVRNEATYCRASVTQKDNDFKHGRNGHNHPCEPGTTAHHHIKAKAKTSATTDMFTSAAEMANNIVSEEQHNAPSLPSLHNLACTINRK